MNDEENVLLFTKSIKHSELPFQQQCLGFVWNLGEDVQFQHVKSDKWHVISSVFNRLISQSVSCCRINFAYSFISTICISANEKRKLRLFHVWNINFIQFCPKSPASKLSFPLKGLATLNITKWCHEIFSSKIRINLFESLRSWVSQLVVQKNEANKC